MSRPVNYTSAVTVNIASFSGLTGSVTSGSTNPPSYGVNSSANTSNYAAFTGSSTSSSGYVYYNFDTLDVPSNATINSVSCVARGRVNYTGRCYAAFQLYAGSTAKGTAVNFNTTTVTACTLNTGSWTASELQNIKLCIIVRRASNNQTGSARFYGSTLTVNYTVNGTEYEVSFDNQSSDATTDPSTTQYVYQGGNQEIKIYVDDIDDIVVKDNNIDVGSSLVEIPETHNIAQVDSVAGASYGFAPDTQYGNYYKSQNGGVASSAAVCRLNITAETQCVLTVYFINYGEANWDFGIIGNLDSALATTSATTTNCKWNGSGNTNSADEQTVTFDITPGSHFVDFKYRKDTNTDSNYDALLFRYELEPGNEPHYYRYTISNIAADHTISIDDAAGGTYYNVNASSTYAGATVSPATQSIREGRNANVQIAVNNLYEIVVKDNGTTVTSSLVQNSTGYTYTVSNVQAIRNITVEEATYYTVTTSSTYAGATATANPSKVYSGRSSTVEIEVDNLYEIVVKDNGTDVTSSIVEMQGGSTTSNFDPTQYVSSASSYDSIYNSYDPTSGVSNSGSTTRACVYSNTGSGAESKLTYKFDCSSIPENATITNVVCAVKCSVYQTRYFATRTVQLYHGDTAKGTATTITATGSNGSVITTNGGSWTRQELNDIAIVQLVTRSTSNPTSDASFSFFGATLAVTYTTPEGKIYTLTNVNTNHTIAIEEAPYYTMSTASTYANASLSVSPQKVYQNQNTSVTVTLSVANKYEVIVRDGNTDITSQFNGSNGTYTYTLNNVNANHTFSVEEAPYYTITVNNSYQDATFTVTPSKGYYGIDVDVRIEIDDIDEIQVFDNGTNVSANIINVGNGVYRYTINAIAANHTITTAESTKYGITATSTYNAVTIEPATATVVEGKSKTFLITPDAETVIPNDITLTDNGVDVTNQIVAGGDGETGSSEYYLTTFDAASSDYVGVYTNSSNVTFDETRAEYHSAADPLVSANASADTRSAFYPHSGEGQTVTVVYNIPGGAVPQGAILDSVTCSGVCSLAYAGSGYSLVTMQLYAGTTAKGEATEIHPTGTGTAASAAQVYLINGGSSWTVSELANAKIMLHGIRNDYNSDSSNPEVRDNVSMHGATMVVHYHYPSGYNYTITNIQSAHTLVITEVPATYYSVNASSTYNEATITPATQSIRNGRSASVQISAASIYDIVVRDNGVNVNLDLVPNETGFTYTLTNIQAAHTIVVSESESFTVTTSSQYQDAQISPATQTVRQGMSAVTYIEVANPAEISITDNGVEVGDQLILVDGGTEYTASSVFDTFDDTNSQYAGVYRTYNATNAEGKSAADGLANTGSTRSALYPATGAGSELVYFYNFGAVNGIPSNAVITNVSAEVVVSAAYTGQGYDSITLQICKGTTPVGNSSAFTPQNAAGASVNVNGGSDWVISDLSSAKIKLVGVRNSTNSNNDNTGSRDNISFHGGTLTVTYTDGETFNGYTYTIQNVQTGHTVVITENPQYTLVASSQVQGVTITPASVTVRGRESATFTISGFTSESVVLDNNVDVTTQLRANSTGHTYTVNNVQSAHTIVISEPSAESDYIKADGQFKKVLGYYKKTSGLWTLVQKSEFDAQVSSGLVFYGGVVVNDTIGEVETDNGAIDISIFDDALASGTYKMVYEDANRTPITAYTTINEFTIQ